MSYIYLLREREFKRLNENIYKIGRTDQCISGRMSGYPKGSELILCLRVVNNVNAEKSLIKMLKIYYKRRLDYGNEYFEGNVLNMTNTILQYLLDNKLNFNNNNMDLERPLIKDFLKDYSEKDERYFVSINEIMEHYYNIYKKIIMKKDLITYMISISQKQKGQYINKKEVGYNLKLLNLDGSVQENAYNKIYNFVNEKCKESNINHMPMKELILIIKNMCNENLSSKLLSQMLLKNGYKKSYKKINGKNVLGYNIDVYKNDNEVFESNYRFILYSENVNINKLILSNFDKDEKYETSLIELHKILGELYKMNMSREELKDILILKGYVYDNEKEVFNIRLVNYSPEYNKKVIEDEKENIDIFISKNLIRGNMKDYITFKDISDKYNCKMSYYDFKGLFVTKLKTECIEQKVNGTNYRSVFMGWKWFVSPQIKKQQTFNVKSIDDWEFSSGYYS